MLFASLASFAYADDIDTLRNNIRADYLAENSYSNAGTILNTQNSNGSWPGINYSDTSNNGWQPYEHLENMIRMSVAYNKTGSGHTNSAAMLDGINRAIDYWFQVNPMCDNGWANIIGAPEKMAVVLILMESQLTSSRIDKCSDYCIGKNMSYGGTYTTQPYYRYKSNVATHQNLVWLAGLHINVSCLQTKRDLAGLNQAFDAIGNEMSVNQNSSYEAATGTSSSAPLYQEGIRQDFSFHAHGRQLYNGGYGRAFQQDVIIWLDRSEGTSFAFNSSEINTLTSAFLDGTQWMIRRGALDDAIAGREMSRPGSMQNVGGNINLCDKMVSGGYPRNSDYQAFKSHMQGNNDGALIGNKHFWLGDYHSHRRSGYMVGIKLLSKRTLSHEAGNGENLEGKYLSQGKTFISLDGQEYADIYPVWDWGRLPGVTSPHKSPAPKPADWYVNGNKGTTTFAGGVSNGTYGVAAYDQNWDGVAARKSWFCFDDEVVCLGSGISRSSGSEQVVTSINQCLRDGTVYEEYSTGSGTTKSAGSGLLSNPKWVHHNNVGYVFPSNSNVQYKNEAQSGSWSKINSSQSSTTITKNVFSLWLEHGNTPSNASYEYILVPDKSRSQLQSYSNSLPVSIMENTSSVQAVRHNGLGIAGIVFYAPDSVAIRSGLTVASDSKAVVLIDESVSPARVWVSHPENLTGTVNLTLSGDLNADLEFTLPQGQFVGSSIFQEVSGGAPPNQAPFVSISTPSNNATYTAPANVTINASASDSDGTISNVKLYVDNVLFSTDTSSPYSWSLSSLAAGSYALKIVATDDDGATTTSSIVNISVNSSGGGGTTTSIDGSGNVTLGTDHSDYFSQYVSGNTTIGGSGSIVTMTGNNCRRFPINYTVTADTVLEFTVESSDTGEIIGVGFDDDDDVTNAHRVFQVGGSTQTWEDRVTTWTADPYYTANSGAQPYQIPVGEHFTGAMSWLVLLADDDANASSAVIYSNIRIYEAGSSNTSIDGAGNVTLGANDMTSYSGQDSAGTTNITSGGASAVVSGNQWKRFPLNYTVTANTVLEFKVTGSDTGEIIGVGFDNDNDVTNANRVFQVGGFTSNWADHVTTWTASPYYTANSGVEPYQIPVGDHYTGSMSWLVLVGDDDANASTSVTFSDIKVYEQIVSVESSDDTHSRDGSNSNTNYGSSSVLQVKDVNYTNYRRRSFIQFPVSEFVGASSVDLLLHVAALGNEGTDNFLVELHQCSSDSWDEDTLTWNNQPSTGTLIWSFELSSGDIGNTVVIDVTSYVTGEASGDGVASFVLVQPTNTDRLIEFSSYESGNGPMLEKQ